jgi:adenylyltransferase/sulfurtransferase
MIYISVSEFDLLLKENKSFQLVDVREQYEYNICKLNSVHIPMADIVSRISEIDTDKRLCVLCKTGKRAEAVANLLETDYDFKDVFVVEGGIMAYAEQIDNNLEIYS